MAIESLSTASEVLAKKLYAHANPLKTNLLTFPATAYMANQHKTKAYLQRAEPESVGSFLLLNLSLAQSKKLKHYQGN